MRMRMLLFPGKIQTTEKNKGTNQLQAQINILVF